MKRLFRYFVGFVLPLLYFCAFSKNTINFCVKNFQKETNVVIDVSNNVAYRYFELSSPTRFVMDFSDKDLVWEGGDLTTNSVVKAVRQSSDAENNRFRVVFDLNYPTSNVVQKEILRNGHLRLSIRFANKDVKMHGRDVVIVIDPGHGGKDPGALGARHKREKDIVLSIAKKLQDAINRKKGFKAYLTRSSDIYLNLRQRLSIARSRQADMFIAIHADAYKQKSAAGASVYALSLRGATSEAARWLADRENYSELMGGVALDDKSFLLKSVLLDLSQTATLHASFEIGQYVLDSLSQVAQLHHLKVEKAAFVVLKSPDVPSILVETGFISNRREEAKLVSSRYQDRLAAAITQGVWAYFSQKPPHGTWLANQLYFSPR